MRKVIQSMALMGAMSLGGCHIPERLPAAATPSHAPAFAEAACGGCHGIEPPYRSPNPAAPPFAQIANRDDSSADALLEWLRDAHNYPEDMDFDLDEDQARELSSYIVSLRDGE